MVRKVMYRKGFKRFQFAVLGLFLFFSLTATIVIYKAIHVAPAPHYGAAFSIMAEFKNSLVIKTIQINLIFLFLTMFDVAILGLFYSHRIAGPLFKVKKHAAVLGEGRFNERIFFRKKDIIHDLSAALNESAQVYQEKSKTFYNELRELEDGLELLNSLPDRSPDRSEEKATQLKHLRELDKKITREIKKMKL